MKKFEDLKSISMIEFITNYLDMGDLLNDKVINLLSKATHKDLKEINIPYVKTIPYEQVTREDVMEGKVILVYDGKSSGKNKRLAPYIRPEILREEELRKEELSSEDKEVELLFRKEKDKDNFKLVLDVREELPETLEIGFGEAAIIILYPDGGIDVVPFDGKSEWHVEYYNKLFCSSKRFARATKRIVKEIDWEHDFNSYKLDCKLGALGIGAIHNESIHDMLLDKTFLDDNKAFFYMFLPEKLSSEQQKVMELIDENYAHEHYKKTIYNSETCEFDREEKRGRKL